MPTGNVVYTRVATRGIIYLICIWLSSSLEFPDYSASIKDLAPITLVSKFIEAQRDIPFHADFANKYIGGGVF